MKFETTFRLFLVVCLMGALIVLLNRYDWTTDEIEKRGALVLGVKSENIDKLVLEWGGKNSVECVKESDGWLITRPFKARANQSQIGRVLWVLEMMARYDVITAEQLRKRDLNMDNFGIEKPRARIVAHDKLKRRTMTIMIGCDVPLSDMIYIKLASQNDVIATSRALFEAIPLDVESLRDRMVLPGDASKTTGVEIHSKMGFVELKWSNGEWYIRQPIHGRADREKVTSMLQKLYALEVREFVWDLIETSSPDGALMAIQAQAENDNLGEQYKLAVDEADARVRVWFEDNIAGEELILGKETAEGGGNVYAKLKDGKSIYAVDKEILKTFSVNVDDLRDKKVFSWSADDVAFLSLESGEKKISLERQSQAGWTIMEPFQCSADQQAVGEFIDTLIRLNAKSFLPATNFSEYGLAPPSYIVRLAKASDVSSNNTVDTESADAGLMEGLTEYRLQVGDMVKGTNDVFVSLEGGNCIMEVSSDMLKNLIGKAVDPLLYRDRTMLSISRDNIRQIILVKKGNEQTAFRDDAGMWCVDPSSSNKVNIDVINDNMFFIANLRALNIAAYNPENLKPYGLSAGDDVTVLTIGLSGNAGIRKSIVFGSGKTTKEDGVYAMIQGQDVVFILDKSQVEQMTRDFIVSSSAAEVK